MDAQQISDLIKEQLPAQEVKVQGEGNKFDLLIVSEVFEGLNAVKKQQAVYALLNDAIASGELHAVTMQTLTPAEWEKQSAFFS